MSKKNKLILYLISWILTIVVNVMVFQQIEVNLITWSLGMLLNITNLVIFYVTLFLTNEKKQL